MKHEDLNNSIEELLLRKREIEAQIKVNEYYISNYMSYANGSTTKETRHMWKNVIKDYKERNRFLGYELINIQKEISDLIDKEEKENDH